MSKWKEFEIDCTNYLSKTYGQYAQFTHQGGEDSTTPDIFVETSTGAFYIDVKHSPAQCGQFVLIPNITTRKFEYSKQNVNRINSYASMIIKHMNKSFDEFREAGTTGKDIIMENGDQIFSDWIIDIYKEKGTKFFITNNYTILPIERVKDYFHITATYRIKRSGSSSVGKSHLDSVKDYINSHNATIHEILTLEDKLFIVSDDELHNQRFVLQGYEYMYSLRDKKYEIRKLSNTYNANVIFSIRLKESIKGLSTDEFITALT